MNLLAWWLRISARPCPSWPLVTKNRLLLMVIIPAINNRGWLGHSDQSVSVITIILPGLLTPLTSLSPGLACGEDCEEVVVSVVNCHPSIAHSHTQLSRKETRDKFCVCMCLCMNVFNPEWVLTNVYEILISQSCINQSRRKAFIVVNAMKSIVHWSLCEKLP